MQAPRKRDVTGLRRLADDSPTVALGPLATTSRSMKRSTCSQVDGSACSQVKSSCHHKYSVLFCPHLPRDLRKALPVLGSGTSQYQATTSPLRCRNSIHELSQGQQILGCRTTCTAVSPVSQKLRTRSQRASASPALTAECSSFSGLGRRCRANEDAASPRPHPPHKTAELTPSCGRRPKAIRRVRHPAPLASPSGIHSRLPNLRSSARRDSVCCGFAYAHATRMRASA
mmetsp:Transcript_17115/g.36169  ORF Transcript_17115/g.36169 Transcript_17115/m.36169 type:complete len:229 (-) Transcript_17115:846-1532(-)